MRDSNTFNICVLTTSRVCRYGGVEHRGDDEIRTLRGRVAVLLLRCKALAVSGYDKHLP